MTMSITKKLSYLVLGAPLALGLAFAMTPMSQAEAGTNDYSCASGYKMKRSGSRVYCEKPGSVRSNRPVCGIKRYKIDGSGYTDWCTTISGSRTGYPSCIGGSRKSVKGTDQCVNSAVKKSSVGCPTGYTLKGSTTSLGGRGSVHCYKPGGTVVRGNRPVCGIKRYKIDGSGYTDWCTTIRGSRTGYPSCIGGTRRSVKGTDQCVDTKAGQTTRPR